MWASRLSTNGAITVPGNWVQASNQAGQNQRHIFAARLAGGSSETSGTWTGAESLIVSVWRSDVGVVLAGPANTTTGSSLDVSYPTIALFSDISLESVVLGAAGMRSTTNGLTTAPTGMTNFADIVSGSGRAVMHQTGPVTSWSATAATVSGTSAQWSAAALQIFESPLALLGGGASFPLIGPGGLVY
jgi:hypothetical protein